MNAVGRQRHPSAFARVLAVLLMLSVVVGGVTLSGCGSSSGDATDGSSDGSATGGGGELSSPDEIGEAIMGLYEDAMNDVVGLMEGRPDAADLKPEVEKLKEDYVQRMVELGRQREKLSDADKSAVDMVVTEGLGMMSAEDVYQDYIDGQAHYMAQDIELANLLADFNILTQWADLELLRSQDPEEADRLGL